MTEKEPNEPSPEFSTGEAASRKLTEGKLQEFMQCQTEEEHVSPGMTAQHIRAMLRNIIAPQKDLMANTPKDILSRIREHLAQFIHPRWQTRREQYLLQLKDARDCVRRGNVAVAKIGDEIVGMAAYRLGGKTEDGRIVYEITKSIVLPSHRKRGIYTQLVHLLVDQIERRNPKAMVLSFTHQEPVKQRCKRMGWKEISIAEHAAMRERIGRNTWDLEKIAEIKKARYQTFLFDPRMQQFEEVSTLEEE